MIDIKVTVKGEPDTAPFRHTFFYADESDEELFYNSVNMIKEKLDKNLKININESLLIYCAYVIGKLRANETISVIERNSQKILTPERVMIGVPESLRKIVFEAKIDKLPKRRVILKEPITTSNYILAAKNCQYYIVGPSAVGADTGNILFLTGSSFGKFFTRQEESTAGIEGTAPSMLQNYHLENQTLKSNFALKYARTFLKHCRQRIICDLALLNSYIS